MNGLLTFNDGAGTVIENGTITTQSLSLNNILATLPTLVCNLWTNLATGTVNIATSAVSIVVGSFTFLGTSIQAGTSGTYNLFTNTVYSSNVNFFSNMSAGTFNIGKGGNINIGQATTGSLIKIDQNGLDTQVIIAPQQTTTGSVSIGSTQNTNTIGSLVIKDKSIYCATGGAFPLNIGYINTPQVNIGGNGNVVVANNTNTTIGSYLECVTSAPNAYIDFHCGGAGANVDYDSRIISSVTNSTSVGTALLQIISQTIRLVGNTFVSYANIGYTYAGYLNVALSGNVLDMNMVAPSNVTPNVYDAQMRVYNGGSYGASNGYGLYQLFNGQTEMIFNADLRPRDLGGYNAIGLGYYSGGGGENASTISGYGPYGGVRFGGCGNSNGYFGNSWRESMTTYPGYGTRFINGGIAFDKGNLGFIGRGWFIQTGSYGFVNTSIAGGNYTSVNLTWTQPFGGTVYVVVQMFANGLAGNTDSLIPTVINSTSSGFTCIVKNTAGGSTGGNLWALHFIGIGTY
jgi:hypothetical protein